MAYKTHKQLKQLSFYENRHHNNLNASYSFWGRNDSFPSETSSSSNSPFPTHNQNTPLLNSQFGYSYMNKFKTKINKIKQLFILPTSRNFISSTSNKIGVNNGPRKNDEEPWWMRTLDPSSEVALIWNRIFLVACLVAVFVDPIFFYLPQVFNEETNDSLCLSMDMQLGAVVTVLRTIADFFYLLHVLLRFRTAFVAPSTRVFGRGELVRDRKEIAKRYIKSAFFFDLIAALPLPQLYPKTFLELLVAQVAPLGFELRFCSIKETLLIEGTSCIFSLQIVIWFIIPAIKNSKSRNTYNALQSIVLIQYFPRLYQIYTLSSEIINAAGVVTKTAWAGAAYNLLLYMLASHILGAAWYLMSVERYTSCWKSACRNEVSSIGCHLRYLDCSTKDDTDRIFWANSTKVFSLCDPDNQDDAFDYGIFGNVIDKGVISDSFMIKYLYCLWWGLQQLSSFGQELDTSTFVWETIFCSLIAIMGLILFALLIGNMETYLQSLTSRVEAWRLRKRDTEEWMKHRQLPQHLQERVRRFGQYKWLATRGVNEEEILSSLPLDLRRDIQRHLSLSFIRRVPLFAQMDDQLLDAICVRLRSSLNIAGSVIVREGDPVTEMLFIVRGKLESSTTNGGRSGFFNSIILRPGDFCGEELLAWALLPNVVNLPSSTRTVRAVEEVEAFSLEAEDLKFVANQFRRLHSKKLQDTFRYYSHQWRAWGACFIQAAWRRYKKKEIQGMNSQESFSSSFMELGSLVKYEGIADESQEEEPNGNIGELSARRKGSKRIDDMELPKMMKPQDPDFFSER
ncbi:putative cyclic nucleotide-gated ion channel 14 [Bienertia sinuspersici]